MIQEWNYTKLSNSTQRAQTLPRPESDPGFKSEFLVSGAGCRPDRSQNITGFILLSARVTSPIAKYRKNRPLTVWEMLLNLLKSPIPQWWEKRKSDPEFVSVSGSPSTVNHYVRVTPCSCLPCLVDVHYRDRELSCSQDEKQNDWTTDHITRPTLAE